MKNLLMALVFGAGVAAAQEGLYDPAPPANSAFVRVLNAPTGTLAGKAVTAEKGAASAYVVIPQGEFAARTVIALAAMPPALVRERHLG